MLLQDAVQWEVHEISIQPAESASIGGKFTISVGGKVSRDIAVDASALAVAAALRSVLVLLCIPCSADGTDRNKGRASREYPNKQRVSKQAGSIQTSREYPNNQRVSIESK